MGTIELRPVNDPVFQRRTAVLKLRFVRAPQARNRSCWAIAILSLLLTFVPLRAQKLNSMVRSVGNHFTYRGGVGLTSPIGGTGALMNEGWNESAGIGYRMNRRFSALVDWQLIRTGMGNGLLEYNHIPSGSYRIWSVSLNPTYNYWYRGRFGGYVSGGVGYSETRTTYRGTSIQRQCYMLCSCYENCSQATHTPGAYHTSSSQPAANVGFGFTMQLSRQHRYRFYAEARYENFYQGSHLPPYKTVEVIPLTVGIQW